MKCYTSDEGRVQKTAAAFTKGLLQIEGALAPILAIMVMNDKEAKKMLDDSSAAKDALDAVKIKIADFMHYKGDDMVYEYYKRFNERIPRILVDLFNTLECPYRRLKEIAQLVDNVVTQI